MADSFAQLLRSELDAVEAELVRLGQRRELVEELLNLDSASPSAGSSAGRARARGETRRAAATAKRRRLPRGLLSGKIREFLGQQREPAHATRILAYLEQHDAAPQSAKPMANLQSALQRLKEMGELENTGRNHWRLRSAAVSAASATSATTLTEPTAPTPVVAAPPPSAGPAVVTLTTRFGSSPGAGQ